jgi:hypothetical protein
VGAENAVTASVLASWASELADRRREHLPLGHRLGALDGRRPVNGLGRYQEAASAAPQVASESLDPFVPMWALPELVEAVARAGDAGLARDALGRLAKTTQPTGS